MNSLILVIACSELFIPLDAPGQSLGLAWMYTVIPVYFSELKFQEEAFKSIAVRSFIVQCLPM
jgi:hypothetical protein